MWGMVRQRCRGEEALTGSCCPVGLVLRGDSWSLGHCSRFLLLLLPSCRTDARHAPTSLRHAGTAQNAPQVVFDGIFCPWFMSFLLKRSPLISQTLQASPHPPPPLPSDPFTNRLYPPSSLPPRHSVGCLLVLHLPMCPFLLPSPG